MDAGWIDLVASLPMTRRRTVHDPLEPTAAPRWYVVRSMHGTVLETRELPASSDLKRAFIAAMLTWIDAGWKVGEFSSTTASFFCDRISERRMVSIDPTDPYDVPMYGGAHLGRCPTCGD